MTEPIIAVPQGAFTVLFPMLPELPEKRLLTCLELKAHLSRIKQELGRVKNSPDAVYPEIAARTEAYLGSQTNAVFAAKKTMELANINLSLTNISLGINVTFLILGFVFTGPIAIGTLGAASILCGTAILGWQLYAQNKSSVLVPSFAIAYERDRALMIGALIGDNAGSTIGRVAGYSINSIALLISANDAIGASNDVVSAKKSLKSALDNLELINQTLNGYGKNKIYWLRAYDSILQAAHDNLERYIAATEHNACIISGPMIKKP